ncbi:MAG: PQQ-binding-like beta-propeller repeat protein [Phycisphaerae bacterium]|nr:PQQ-binding-like beta-propeller repeat protein [Phycisphaerae bacterium]
MEAQRISQRYSSAVFQSAVGVAIVAGVFCLIIAGMMAVQAYHMKTADPARAAELEAMKVQARQYPADEALARSILQLDTQIRRDQFARLYFLQRGMVLLAAAAAVCVGAVLGAGAYRPRTPVLKPQGDLKMLQIRQAVRIRTALTITLIVMGAAGLFWMFSTPAADILSSGGRAEIPDDSSPVESQTASMEEMLAHWPTFRGPEGLGICRFENIPEQWDGPTEKNILWKAAVPLPGHNSPIVWGNHVYLTGATKERQQIFCFDARSGQLLWAGDVSIPPSLQRDEMDIMEETGYAASTAVTDGRRVCAIFAGGDMGCFSADGRRLWEKHLGVPESAYGYAASLTAFENLVIVQWDVGFEPGGSKLMALDWLTGKTIWETARPVPNSWSSPTAAQVGGQWRLLTAGSPFVIVYDPKTGAEQFRAACIEGDIAVTPITAGGRIFVVEPYNKLVALDAQNVQDQAAAPILWQAEASMPDICSPVTDGHYIWTLTTEGGLNCFRVSDGSKIYSQQLSGNFLSSPTLVGDVLYLLSEKGTMILARTGQDYAEIRRNEIGEKCFASPAFAPGRIYIRTMNHLFCIGKSD